MASNYPDGMREGDIPGYWDIECPRCEDEGYTDDCPDCEGSGMVDSRDRNTDYSPSELDDEPW